VSRLWSPAGGIPDHPPPFGVWVGDPVPAARPPAPARPRGRRSLAVLVAAGILVTAMITGSVVSMVDRLGATTPPRPVRVPPPTLDHLNAAIARGEAFLDGLYKPLGPAGAVQSEHYALPIRVRFGGSGRWVLLGQPDDGACQAGDCPAPTRIRSLGSSYASEAYELTFATPARADGLRLRAGVDWDAGPGRYRVSVSLLAFDDPAGPAEVWLDDVRLGSFRPGPAAGQPPLRRSFPVRDVSHLRSFRFTVRHATQLAWLHAVSREDKDRSTALARFMLNAGFVPGRDLRAAIFGQGRDEPRDFGYRHEPFLDAYGDCRLDPPTSPLAYPYRSKACLADVRPYLLAARHDTLLPAIEALQALNRGDSPDHSYRDQSALLPMASTSAARTADALEERFDRLGFGIPRCAIAIGCDQERASALRTFAFGMLETVLGYNSGQLDRRPYADAVAGLALSVQVGDDGVVRAADRVAYRPALRGGFLSYWNRDRRYLKPSGVAQSVADHFNMPPEYLGLRPTDSETGFDAYAFLALYRCARYQVGCKLVGAAGGP
jgi:hypothetical protein